ncbi:MAG: BamA/TamA family outer membrane protein [Bacteroidetes bacterium]|nr:BamA/TamA family outer membrane protein [Bacteroidota bacterium]
MKKALLILVFVLFGCSMLHAQEAFIAAEDHPALPDSLQQQKPDTVKVNVKECKQGAIGDIFRKKEKTPKPPKKFMALVLPNISSNPSNGFLLGVGGSFGWYMGPKENTKVSSAPFTVAVTSKSQLITFLKHNIYTKGNQYFLQGDWKFYIYSQPTYGLGTNSPDTVGVPSTIDWMGEGTNTDSVYFPMKFYYVRVHEIVNKKVLDNLYAGVGFHLDYYYSINDEDYRAATDSTPEMQTPHSFYSSSNNFNQKEYMLSGLSANFLYDSRDNQINPYKGYYANVNYRINPTFLGSSQNSSTLWLEFRTYIGLSKKTPRHLIGFWAFGDFLISGKLPYLTLPSLGEDQRARSGRGYTNGRFRGDHIVYGEVEYRFPIWPCSHIIGGVLFANAVTTSNKARNVALFEYIRPAVGIGLRIMVNKYFRTNINLDYAIGMKSQGFYFSGQETF